MIVPIRVLIVDDHPIVRQGLSLILASQSDMELVAEAANADEAIRLAGDDDQIFVIGGAQVYESFLPRIERLHWTSIDANIDGDTFFPDVDWTEWKCEFESHHSSDEKNQFDSTYRVYQRLTKGS